MQCIFCHNQELESRFIYRDHILMVFPTNIPIVPGHILICPIRHIAKFSDLTNEELLAVQKLIIRLQATLTKLFEAEGFNIALNEGVVSGQSVPHLHIHLLPRKTGDTGVHEYDPRKFLYRPGSREESPEKELETISKLIKDNLSD